MRTRIIGFLILLLAATAAPAQVLSDVPALLAEIRQLRVDLQTTTATVQRVQIVIYRLQSQSIALDRATDHREQVRATCGQAQGQQKRVNGQIERLEESRRAAQDASSKKQVEDELASLRSQNEWWATQQLQCQADQVEADTQLRAEQSKMTDLEEQLDKLDKLLAANPSKEERNR